MYKNKQTISNTRVEEYIFVKMNNCDTKNSKYYLQGKKDNIKFV